MSPTMLMASRGKRSYVADTDPCSSTYVPAKRTRHSTESAQNGLSDSRYILRPGIPPAIRVGEYRFADKPSPPLRTPNEDGHYVYDLGENISSRYKILSKMGEGTFGRVLECWDRLTRDYVAIKIVRNVDKYRHAAMLELEALNTLEKNDPTSNKHCVVLREWFDYRGHVCMVFEKLGPSLYDFLRRNEYQPFPIQLVQHFCRQLLEAIAYMHELTLIHTDLKPENILLAGCSTVKEVAAGSTENRVARKLPRSSEIKVIDFGSATFEDQYHSSIVSTRHYRAPEVILGLGWSFACDMWSVGCILVELLAGDALFQTHENLEHLAMMEKVLGPIPADMAATADAQARPYFTRSNRLNWPAGAESKKSQRVVAKLLPLEELLATCSDASARPYVGSLAGLVRGLLAYRPAERLTAAQALQHPFFQMDLGPLDMLLEEEAVQQG